LEDGMAKHLLYSEVTCHLGGKTHSKGVSFQSERPKKIEDPKIADRFRNHPWFTVLDYWHEDIEKISAVKVEKTIVETVIEDGLKSNDVEDEEQIHDHEEVEESQPKEEKPKLMKKLLKKKTIKKSDEE
jgi:hypothetical protein